MDNEAAQVHGGTVLVTLADEVPRKLAFDFEALYRLEEGAGTLQVWLDETGEGGYGRRKLWAVVLGLQCGLWRYSEPQLQEDPRFLPTARVRRLCNFQQMTTYLDAVMEAFWLAVGPPGEVAADPKAPAPAEGASPGPSSTASHSSDLVAPTPSSGA
jgi:hypothetical protein